jgi:protoheme IX farnesyltransferase
VNRVARYATGALVYTILVILFGAFLRASVSGDGCGMHWPLCNGEILPSLANVKSVLEYTHRVTSGLLLPMVIVLWVWTRRATPPGHPARGATLGVVAFTISEALIGAALVLGGFVAKNDSVARALWMCAHLVNTFVLLALFTLAVCYLRDAKPIRWRSQGEVGWLIGLSLVGVLVLAISGAITALGDMLYPVGPLTGDALSQMSPTAHFLQRLRLFHPLIAVSIGLFVTLAASYLAYRRPAPDVRRYSRLLVLAFCVQLGAGLLNLVLSAPYWMQLLHLLLADLVWIVLILLARAAMSASDEREVLPAQVVAEPAGAGIANRGLVARFKQYLLLTKPRVISLLLFTTLAAMFAAAGGWPGGWLLVAVAVGGYMAAGAANTVNMVLERDLDERMRRTSKRPTVTHDISPRNALIFGVALAVGSTVILTLAANALAAILALCGLLFYVIVYTLMLKRRTWHNIVIGGAAGAFPPLVGWAAVTGELSPLAWYLFAIIFLWTPVHFWALALLIKDDYASAGVPMAPVVLGEKATVLQMVLYAILTGIVSILPVLQPGVGWFYVMVAAALNVVLIARCVQLYLAIDRPRAVRLYKFSMAYLALLFVAAALDWSGRPAPNSRVPDAKRTALGANLGNCSWPSGAPVIYRDSIKERSNGTTV